MLELDFSLFPALQTPRLGLRDLLPSDAPALFAMRSDPRVMQHIGRTMAVTEQDAVDLIERIAADRKANAGITWGMTLNGSDELIGTIGYYRLKHEHHTAEVGYMLHADHWGKGLMTEALEVVVRCGFEQFMFHRIEAITAPANEASRALLEKCGFTLEGILKENYLWNEVYHDSCIFGRLRKV